MATESPRGSEFAGSHAATAPGGGAAAAEERAATVKTRERSCFMVLEKLSFADKIIFD